MKRQRYHINRDIEIESKTEVLASVRQFIGKAARDFGFDEDDIMKIEIAVDEACTNIIKHAYDNQPNGSIHITVSEQSENSVDKFIISITDRGKSFDTAKYTVPNMKEYFKQLRRGGLGVFLMKKMMDEVEYGSQNNKENSIRLVKYLPSASA